MNDRAHQAAERIAADLARRRPDICPLPWLDAWASIIRGEYIASEAAAIWQVGSAVQLERIRRLCQKHNSPASNPGAHALAAQILEILGDDE